MSATICPTVTAYNLDDYSVQLVSKTEFADRIHIDLMDGDFVATKSPSLNEIWFSSTVRTDVHLMYQRPEENIEKLVLLKPDLVIIHAEAEVRHMYFAAQLHKEGIKAGLALLPDTKIEQVEQILPSFDHILIFSGNLGHQGGSNADFSLLEKIKKIKQLSPDAEIGWDGGANDQNIKQLVDGGVDVINVGGFIQNSNTPKASYDKLISLAV